MTILMAKGCSQETKNDLEKAEITYTANSRGFFKMIVIKDQTITVSNNRDGRDKDAPAKIQDADWKELVGYFQEIQLDSLETYKDPTQARFYDGAAIANMTVKYQDKEYNTISFDHGTPPVEIKKLVTKILSFKTND